MAKKVLTDLNLNNFLSQLNIYNNVAKSARFAVLISLDNFDSNASLPLDTRELMYVCESVEFPGRGFDLTEVRYYGPSQVFPNNSMYQQANFSFICRQSSKERKFFDDWMDIINPTTDFNFEYPSKYYSTVQIFQMAEYNSNDAMSKSPFSKINPQTSANPLKFEEEQQIRAKEYAGGLKALPQTATAGDVIYGWTLRKAYPILVNPQQVTWADNDILRLQVTFTYKYWDRDDFKEQ